MKNTWNKIKHFFKNIDKNTYLVSVAVIAVVIVGVLIFAKSSSGFSVPSLGLFGPSDQQIAQKSIDYINNSGLTQSKVTLSGAVTEASGLVKFKLKLGTNEFDSYATKDGKLLFPQAFDMSTVKTTAAAPQNSTAAAPSTTVTKSANPILEAYIVSSCPFGLQMQRAIAEAVKELPALAQYVKIRYIGNVSGSIVSSMHGPEEGAENLRQICIRDEQPTKFYSYLSCYMQKTTATAAGGMPLGDSPSCQASTGVDTTKLNACVSDPKRGLADAQKDFDLDTKYSIQGSPTLILNGASVSENGYGGRSADGVKAMVCAGFSNQPSFCTQKLNTSAATTSFSLSYASTSGASANTNCAPAAQ